MSSNTPPIQLTVLFASYNGAEKLPRMLDALCNQTLDKAVWKIVAVNNNSTDNTLDILQSYAEKLPIEIHAETARGKGAALDTGFRHLEGDLVVITDDDVIPSPDWLEQYLQLADAHPEYDMFGGLISPAWDKEPPEWVLTWVQHNIVYALNEDFPAGEADAWMIFGPNSAFRRPILPNTYTVASENVGPKSDSNNYPMGGDTVFSQSLGKQGYRAYHSRDVKVQHIIPAKYLDENWILGRATRFGRGMPYQRPAKFARHKCMLGYPVKPVIRWLWQYPLAKLVYFLPHSRFRFDFIWDNNWRSGALMQEIQMRKENNGHFPENPLQ